MIVISIKVQALKFSAENEVSGDDSVDPEDIIKKHVGCLFADLSVKLEAKRNCHFLQGLQSCFQYLSFFLPVRSEMFACCLV